MRWIREFKPKPEHNRLYIIAMAITFGGNVILALGKGIAAWISGSAALYSDAANSISDVVYSLLMVLGLWAAMQPPDTNHPQGHSRFEPLVGLMVTVVMFIAGFMAARNAYLRFTNDTIEPIAIGLPTIILLVSAAAKMGMFISVKRIAHKLLSPALGTIARDNLSDVLTSLAAFLGVLFANLIHPMADPIVGFIVALWIFRNAFVSGKENLGFLTGVSASKEEVQQFLEAAQEVDGVLKVHHIITEYVGPRLILELHVNVDGNTTLYRVHEISDEVTKRLEQFSIVDRAYVHVEPEDWND